MCNYNYQDEICLIDTLRMNLSMDMSPIAILFPLVPEAIMVFNISCWEIQVGKYRPLNSTCLISIRILLKIGSWFDLLCLAMLC